MRVAVFGAGGWLGRAIISNVQASHDITAVDLSACSWDKWNDVDPEWNGKVIYGDISDYSHVEEVILRSGFCHSCSGLVWKRIGWLWSR